MYITTSQASQRKHFGRINPPQVYLPMAGGQAGFSGIGRQNEKSETANILSRKHET
jgi:hypothetical protein